MDSCPFCFVVYHPSNLHSCDNMTQWLEFFSTAPPPITSAPAPDSIQFPSPVPASAPSFSSLVNSDSAAVCLSGPWVIPRPTQDEKRKIINRALAMDEALTDHIYGLVSVRQPVLRQFSASNLIAPFEDEIVCLGVVQGVRKRRHDGAGANGTEMGRYEVGNNLSYYSYLFFTLVM